MLVMAPWLPITKASSGTSVYVPYAAVSALGWALFLYNPDHWSADSTVSDSILSPEAINKALAAAITAGLPTTPYGSWGHMVNALQDFAVSHPSIPELWLSDTDVEAIEHGTVAMQPDEPYEFLAEIQLNEMARSSRSMAGMALFEVLSSPRLAPATKFMEGHPMVTNADDICDIFANMDGPIKRKIDSGAPADRIMAMQRSKLVAFFTENAFPVECLQPPYDDITDPADAKRTALFDTIVEYAFQPERRSDIELMFVINLSKSAEL